jgi:hypothetical protein
MLDDVREMVNRLKDVEVRRLYESLSTGEARATARNDIARYVMGELSRTDLLSGLRALHRTEEEPPPPVTPVKFKVSLGVLRSALEAHDIQPEAGWGSLDDLPGETEVTVEVRPDVD